MRIKLSVFLLFLVSSYAFYGQNATLFGVVKDQQGKAISNVSIQLLNEGTTTDQNGEFQLQVATNKEFTITCKHIAYKTQLKKFNLKPEEQKQLTIILSLKVETIDEVEVKSHKNEVEGLTGIKVETVQNLSSTNPSIESTLKIIGLGTSSDNELSTQYKVRGGNYDENLVYVNGIEVYRPFLVRSGQQEGLSFVNVDMTQNVKFSSGGFQAKYGDKLSSVLDISYRKPTDFGVKAELSLLGASATIDGASKNKKTTALLGLRYRDNSLLVDNKDVTTNFKPRFIDIQSYFTHQINNKFSLDFLGTYAINDYNYIPTSRRTKFGSLQEPLELIVNYYGQEKDEYLTAFGALSANYLVSDSWKLNVTTSVFNTQEEEYFDIEAFYALGAPDPDAGTDEYGETEFAEGIGSQLNHSRNALDALIGNIQVKASYFKNQNKFEFGAKFQLENIKDRLVEWEFIDSAGFSIRPPNHIPNEQPYEAYEGPIVPYQSIRASNTTDIQRITAFAQWNRKSDWNDHEVWTSLGLRAQQWNLNNSKQTILSPRAQIAIKPNWEKDIILRLSGGRYVQPPFYKELRDGNGLVNDEVEAQKSIHVVIGADYSFKMWDRPFKLVTEAYYKHITNVNPYTLDNVRIRYLATNNAVAFASGLDLRINGEFVPGTESWFSFSYLNTQENIDDQGYIARPSDQRLKFSLLFQDYVPNMPHLKMYMNLVYNTGVPGGSPTYADPYDFQARLGDYKRADLGIFYVFKDATKQSNKVWLSPFKEFSIGGEIFNMFDMQNAITNTWVRDVYSKQMYGIKNYMTGRIFNVKLKVTL